MKTRKKHRILSLLLTAAMLFSMLPLNAMAEAGRIVVTAFDRLSEDKAAQSVDTGTPQENLNLPITVIATIGGAKGTLKGISWECTSPIAGYDMNTPGIYTFTAVLPESYVLDDGVTAPAITVTVETMESGESKVKTDADPDSDISDEEEGSDAIEKEKDVDSDMTETHYD